MSEESSGFWSGLFRLIIGVYDRLVEWLARAFDWVMRTIANIGQWFVALAGMLFEFGVKVITRLLALPSIVIGLVLSVIGAFISLVVYALVSSTSFPLLAQNALASLFNSLGLNGFFYFLINYLAFDTLISYGMLLMGFSVVLMGFGFVFRILFKIIPHA